MPELFLLSNEYLAVYYTLPQLFCIFKIFYSKKNFSSSFSPFWSLLLSLFLFFIIHLFLAMLGFCCGSQAFSSW